MGWRFRRSVRIVPGLRVNLGKREASLALGRRGFNYTIGPHATRTTVGLAGTGLSYTSYQPRAGGRHGGGALWLAALVVIALIALMLR